MPTEKVVDYLIQAWGLAGVVILALALAVVFLYKRTCYLEEERLKTALSVQGVIKEFTDTFKMTLDFLKANPPKPSRRSRK